MTSVSGKCDSWKKAVSDNVWDLWPSYSPNFKYPRAGDLSRRALNAVEHSIKHGTRHG